MRQIPDRGRPPSLAVVVALERRVGVIEAGREPPRSPLALELNPLVLSLDRAVVVLRDGLIGHVAEWIGHFPRRQGQAPRVEVVPVTMDVVEFDKRGPSDPGPVADREFLHGGGIE